MDLARFRSRAPTVFEWREQLIGVRPLAQGVLEEIYSAAAEIWEAVGVTKGRGVMIERMIGIVAESACEPARPWPKFFTPDQVRALDLHGVQFLFEKWLEAQRDDYPDIDQMMATCELEYARAREGSSPIDGSTIVLVTPDQFFGEPTSKLSVGQISYYRCIRAIEEKRNQPGEKCVSLSMLQKRARKDR